MKRRLSDYARFQRWIRARQPKVSSSEAHAQAQRVLAAAREQNLEELPL